MPIFAVLPVRTLRSLHADLRLIKRHLAIIMERTERMATQDDVNELAQQVTTLTDNIRADIARIEQQHPEVDLTSLRQSVAGLSDLAAENPEPQQP